MARPRPEARSPRVRPAALPVLLALTAGVFAGGCARDDRPNILLVILDTARADRFPWQGYAKPTAPRLAELARDGAVYTQAFSPGPWTVPAHASLFTGQYPSLHRTDCGSLRLPDEAATLAETLRASGYRTIGYTANPWIGKGYNFHQGFDTYVETWRDVPDQSEDTGATITNERVIRWLRWRQENREARRQPFFLFINYFEPHLPYHPPEPERTRLIGPGADPRRVARLSRLSHPEEMRFIMGISDLDGEDLALLNALYDGEIAYVDRKVGEILDTLRGLGILDRTVIAVAGDHGENIGDHGMMDHKLSVHDTLLHVPLLLRYPPRVPPGQVVPAAVQLHDLHPTILALAGVPPPAATPIEAVPLPGAGVPTPGRDPAGPIVAEFVGPPVEFLDVLEDLFPGQDLSRFDRKLVALRQGGWKIHWGSDGRHALFHVVEDPGETRDLATAETGRVQAFENLVDAWLRRDTRRSWQPGPGAPPP